jgi:hypothetical protein
MRLPVPVVAQGQAPEQAGGPGRGFVLGVLALLALAGLAALVGWLAVRRPRPRDRDVVDEPRPPR